MVRIAKTAAALAIAAPALHAATIFSIGKPDARAAEFNNFGVNFNSTRYYYRHGTDPYAPTKKFFSKPFVFDASRQSAAEFPFVYPWAPASGRTTALYARTPTTFNTRRSPCFT